MHNVSKIILGGLLVAFSLGDADAQALRRAGAPGVGARPGVGAGAPGAGATVRGLAGVGRPRAGVGAGAGAPGAGATVRGPAGVGR